MAKEARLDDVEKKVRDLIVEILGADESEVTLNADLRDDLGADSLDAVEITMALEEAFGLDPISDERAEKLKTVKDVVEFVNNELR